MTEVQRHTDQESSAVQIGSYSFGINVYPEARSV